MKCEKNTNKTIYDTIKSNKHVHLSLLQISDAYYYQFQLITKKNSRPRTVLFTNVKCKCEVLIVKTVRKSFNREEKNKGKFWECGQNQVLV